MMVVVDQAMMTSMITDHVIKRLQVRSTTALLTGWHADCTLSWILVLHYQHNRVQSSAKHTSLYNCTL
jgi:hypothetical protein